MDGHAIFATVEALCSFGARWMGAQAVDRVKGFLSQEMAAIGLSLGRQKFRFRNYILEEARLRVLDAAGAARELVCEPVACSRPLRTPLDAVLLAPHVGASAAPSPTLAPSPAVYCLRGPDLQACYASACARGAAAAILATDLPGHAIRCVVCSPDGSPGRIPAVSIAGHDALSLFRQLEHGQPLRAVLDVHGGMREAAAENLLFSLPGALQPPALLLARYDSFWNGVHAMDGAAGLALLLHLARELSWEAAWEGWRETLFCAAGAQTLGRFGEAACRDALFQAGRAPHCVVELGPLGSREGRLEIAASPALQASPRLTSLLREAVEAAGVAVDVWSTLPPDDPATLLWKHIPCLRLADSRGDPVRHTPLDVPSRLSQDGLARAARLARECIRLLCSSPPVES
ncbi:MAG: M28 family peptidase [Desulfovibrio sp.]|nr:M28 family peptidase [Desulfovibrio sp.]